MTIQRIASKYAAAIVVSLAGLVAFFTASDLNKRMFGQFLTIISYMAVVIAAYAQLSCPRRRVGRAVRKAVFANDFRLLAAMLRNRKTVTYLLCFLGAACCCIGAIAQVNGDQVADKPILFHIGAPLVCVVLFWSVIYPKKQKRDGHDTEI